LITTSDAYVASGPVLRRSRRLAGIVPAAPPAPLIEGLPPVVVFPPPVADPPLALDPPPAVVASFSPWSRRQWRKSECQRAREPINRVEARDHLSTDRAH
jgi:hypothetical protein